MRRGTAPEPHQLHIASRSRTKDVRASRQALALRVCLLVARTRVRMDRIPGRPLGRKRAAKYAGRERIRLRARRAKPLTVDRNPYARLWAHFITYARATFYQAASRSLF